MTDLATRARSAAQAAQVKLHDYRTHERSGAALITVEILLADVPEAVKAGRPGDPFMLALVALDHNGVEPVMRWIGQRIAAVEAILQARRGT